MRKIEISHRTIIFTILLLLGMWFVWQIRQVILALFVAFLIATALRPIVDRLMWVRVPRGLAILLSYVIVVGGVVWILILIIQPLIDQTSDLVSRLPDYLSSVGLIGVNQQLVIEQLRNLGTIPADVVRLAVSLFSNILALFGVLVLAFYWLLERARIDRRLPVLFGNDSPRVRKILSQLEEQLGGWVRGELVLMVIIGILTYIGLRLLNIQYALPLALLAGLLEIIPNVGPIVSAIPAVIIGLTVSPVVGLLVALLYFVVQQLENSLIVPKVMERSVGLPPLFILLALGIGFQISGILGAILAVPVVLIIKVLVYEFAAVLKLS